MKTKESWIIIKEVIGGFIRFVVMAGLGYHIIHSQINLYKLIEAQKIIDWRVILVMQGAIMTEMIMLIIAYTKLGITTTSAHATKLSLQTKIGGQEFSLQHEKDLAK